MPALPRGTVTFLFTDIEGSTRLWQAHHDAMVEAYARHDVLLREAITSHGGIVYKTIGDALQVAFPTAPEAVMAALAAQLSLQGEDWAGLGLPEPLRVRMALHTGAVDPDPDGDYRSPVLNRLGRLLGAGHGDQVLLSAVTYELVRDHLPGGVTLRDLGEQQLKDLYRPERVYQLAASGVSADFPPLRTLDARPNNLPRQPTQFVGRETDVAALGDLLGRDEVRLVTLTGPGGMGKTRLSLQVAADLLERFADGVWLVELAALTDPALVPSAIATTLGVQQAGDRSLAALLAEHLAEKQLLLVLDNFEQVTGAATVVGDLLAGCSRLKVLATSRIRLGLRWEHDYPVSPLALPDHRRLHTIAALSQYEAVRLFVERAQAAKPTFAVTNQNAPAVAEICVRLDGLPLALELAAARIRMLPPEAMLKRLHSRLPLLTGGARDLPERQRTLRGAIAWSHELLTPDEQALFRRLSVFAGGATLEAIEAVAAADELSLDIFEGLERLVDHSLLRQTESEGEPRFTMLETIREFGLEQLSASGEANEAHQRHATFFTTLAETAFPNSSGAEQGAWLDRLEAEHNNLRAALEWLLAHGVETVLDLMANVWWFWLIRGYLREGRRWLMTALEASTGSSTVARARVLHGASILAGAVGDRQQARTLGEEALALSRALGSDRGIATSLNNLANLASENDLARAQALYEECLEMAQRLGNDDLTATVTLNLGNVAAFQEDFDRASVLYEEALVIWRRTGDIGSQAFALQNLGNTALYAHRDPFQAVGRFQEALEIFFELKDQSGIIHCLKGVAGTAGLRGQTALAARLYGAADALRQEIGEVVHSQMGAVEDSMIAEIRQASGEVEFATAYAAGQRLSPEAAVAEALADEIAGAAAGET